MTGIQYTALAYVFASLLLVGYAVKLWWAFRPKPGLGNGDGS